MINTKEKEDKSTRLLTNVFCVLFYLKIFNIVEITWWQVITPIVIECVYSLLVSIFFLILAKFYPEIIEEALKNGKDTNKKRK